VPSKLSRSWWRSLIATEWVLLVVGSTAALAVFAALGEEIAEPGTNAVDRVVRGWMLALQSPLPVACARRLTLLGSSQGTAIIALAAAAWLWLRRHRWVAAAVTTAPAIASVAFATFKSFFQRARPMGALAANIHSYAFPSGHATASAAVWLSLAYCLRRERILPTWAAALLGFGWPALIGLTRLYLDVHWATDVLGGWCLGAAIAAVTVGVYEQLLRERPPPPREAGSPPGPAAD
jgi:undecaprenyl-diphosphatase